MHKPDELHARLLVLAFSRQSPVSWRTTKFINHAYCMLQVESKFGFLDLKSPSNEKLGFVPIFRSGSCFEKGPKQYMEDEYISVDNFHEHLGIAAKFPSPCAFYGAVKNAFVKVAHAFLNASSLDSSSGTTTLIALITGRTMLIANVGDSQAVLGKQGRAIELSKDHKPNCTAERLRIENLGVARALGDWHIKGSKGSKSPLSFELELEEILLSEEDEFLIIGCDGLWDVMSSQCAVTMVRKELIMHNDPDSCDNLTIVVVYFSPDPPPKIEIPRSQKRRSISAEGLDLLKGVLNNIL
ncbi:putative protein phosphatase 2c 47 [Quercus suber]|uniref:PPM-type phosphatase domain-containing protein n=1 Tax=Quercus suber TaxID=58331 RepID=A0AAW0KQG4_QUESU